MPMYHIERKIEETGESFNDGSHIIYVNGNYHGDDPVGKLVHDFRSRNSNDMFYSELSDSVKHFKETEGGRRVMCRAVEEYGDMRAAIAAAEAKAAAEAEAAVAVAKAEATAKVEAENRQTDMIKNLMDTMKLTPEEAMNALKIPEKDRVTLMKKF
jgi:hypothetical protein